MTEKQTVKDAQAARKAAIELNNLTKEDRNKALENIALALDRRRDEIIKANEEDLVQAKEDNLSEPIIQRLKFNNKKMHFFLFSIKCLIIYIYI